MTDTPVKILVVEDEMIIGANVALFLNELGYEVTGIIPAAAEAMANVAIEKPDIALLDIQLKGEMDGIALAHILQQEYQIPVIFLTANSDNATFDRAKNSRPYAFLTKPFRRLDLKRAVELTISLMAGADQEKPATPAPPPDTFVLSDRIFVRDKDKMVKIMLDSILYLEAERNYCRIVTQTREYLLSMPMKSLETQLPEHIFQRIHRSFLVNIKMVDEVTEGQVLIGSKSLPLSKSLRDAFLLRIKTV